MFAENEKISAAQLRSLLFLDWIGKLLLLLPALCRPVTGWNFLAASALGIIWMLFYLYFPGQISRRIQGSFSAYLKNRFGKWASCVTGILFLIYLFGSQTCLTRLTGRICKTFLLPEVSETAIALLVLTAGIYTAAGSGQKRGRLAQCLALPVGLALTVMLAASMFAVNVKNLTPDTGVNVKAVFQKSGVVFASFAAVTLVLYETPYINWETDNREGTLRHCVKAAPVFLMLAFLTAIGTLGEKSFSLLPWPAITMMGDVKLPGNFLQRWDAVFLAFLLFSFLLTAGTCCHYAHRIIGELLPEKKNSHILWGIFTGMAALIVVSRTYERAVGFFATYIVRGVIPLMLALPVILWLVECGRKRCEKIAKTTLLILLCSIFLCGCTARELEDRVFPLAMELELFNDGLYGGFGSSLVSADSVEEIKKETQQGLDKYLDLGHVKVIVIGKKLLADKERAEEVLRELEQMPSVSGNCLVFAHEYDGQESFLKKLEEAGKNPGEYLSDLEKNNPYPKSSSTKTLAELLGN